ncbi:hypothetical protein NL676_013215 [Syzygium grande]|nr:hypothetical protein NL676_013215 [Syzygium grande]
MVREGGKGDDGVAAFMENRRASDVNGEQVKVTASEQATKDVKSDMMAKRVESHEWRGVKSEKRMRRLKVGDEQWKNEFFNPNARLYPVNASITSLRITSSNDIIF